MAVIFNTQIAENRLLFSHTNNVVRFTTDTTTKTILNAKITFNGVEVVLYPSPRGVFYFNFKEYISSIINQIDLADNQNINIDSLGYIYDNTNNVYLDSTALFTIYFTDETFETSTKSYKWLLGVVQVEEYKKKVPLNQEIQTPTVLVNSYDSTYLKYWEGYPFDISIYTGVSSSLLVQNQTNLLSHEFTTLYKVNRLFLSDGRTDVSLEDLIPLVDGTNKLKLTSNTFYSYLYLEKVEAQCDGFYFKFLNSFGGWSYWFFNYGAITRSTKNQGDIFNDFENLNETVSKYKQIGKDAQDQLKVQTEVLSKDELYVIQDILESPKVYLFTGDKYAKNNYNDWVEVLVKDSTYNIKNPKNIQTQLFFNVELPQRNTIQL